jgi:predicted metal-dependent hydrolase
MDRRAANGALPAQLNLFEDIVPEAGRFVRLSEREISFRFVRTKRRTIAIAVDASGLSVSAPRNAPWREIEAFVREKQRWILARLEEWAGVPRPSVIRGVSGETLPLFGAPHTLEVLGGRGAVARDGARVVVCAASPRRVPALLVAWLKRQALTALVPRTVHYAARLGLPAPPVALSRARTQWGVCTERGAIRLNWRLVHLAPALADYVVAHEVAHLVELNHSKRFWNLLERLYPDCRGARERIELAGAALPHIWGL